MTFAVPQELVLERRKIAGRWWLIGIADGEAVFVAGSTDFRAKDDPEGLMMWLLSVWPENREIGEGPEDTLPDVRIVSAGWFGLMQDEIYEKAQEEHERRQRQLDKALRAERDHRDRQWLLDDAADLLSKVATFDSAGHARQIDDLGEEHWCIRCEAQQLLDEIDEKGWGRSPDGETFGDSPTDG